MLAQGSLCICDLEQLLGMTQSKVSYHMAQLKDAGLMTCEALNPSVKFIADLENTVLKQEKLREDRQAIIQTVVTCGDAFELSQHSPDHLAELKKLNAKSTPEQRISALGKFAGRAYATRNALAHAKANYRRGMPGGPVVGFRAVPETGGPAGDPLVRRFAGSPVDFCF